MNHDEHSLPNNIRRTAQLGIFWSIIQSWGGKLVAFGLSILLARLLSPEEFGIASAAALVLMLIPMVAEFGFGDAILQRQNLKSRDINLPFYFSIGIVTILVLVVTLMSGDISAWLGKPELAFYVTMIAGTMIINTLTQFQEAVYKRKLAFRTLALRTLNANLLGGATAVVCAGAGFGIWSFVAQAYVASLIGLLWLWWRPQWKPGLELNPLAFRQMLRFGLPIVGQRLVDFAGSRFLDLLIVSQLGLALYGVYIVGSKLYLTMMELLQGALYSVSLTVLSTIASDRERTANIYLKTIGLSSAFVSPVFVMVSVLSPEICHVLFGEKWQGVDDVAMVLLLLGAIQCVQYMNAAFLGARGRPEINLIAGTVKTVSPILGLLLLPTGELHLLVTIFVVGQLMATPVSFYFVSRELGLSALHIVRTLAPAVANGIVSFLSVTYARPYIALLNLNTFWQGVALGGIYALVWLVLIAALDHTRFRAIGPLVMTKLRQKSQI